MGTLCTLYCIRKINYIKPFSTRLYTIFSTNNVKLETVNKRYISSQTSTETFISKQYGIFQWLSESTPVAYAQDFILNVHSTTGLPWWASIILTTFIIRSSTTFPIALYQNYILAKLENIKLEMPAIVKELNQETVLAIKKFNLSETQAKILFNRSVRKQWLKLIVRDNCHPLKTTILLWIQLPMWVCISTSFRNLVYMLPHSDVQAYITFTELSLGGFGWIPNLVVPDATFILPVFLGLLNLAIIEIQTASKKDPPTKYQKYAINFFRGVSIFMIPIAATVPSCMALYWTSSSLYGLMQNLILLSPKLRRLSRIPKTQNEIAEPYTHIVNQLKSRFV